MLWRAQPCAHQPLPRGNNQRLGYKDKVPPDVVSSCRADRAVCLPLSEQYKECCYARVASRARCGA